MSTMNKRLLSVFVAALFVLTCTTPVSPPPEIPPQRPPVAAFTASPPSGDSPLTVSFDGSGSSDPDEDSLTFAWDFGDGTTGTGPALSHVYTSPGSYAATLTVNDGHGNSGNESAAITVFYSYPTSAQIEGLRGAIYEVTTANVDLSLAEDNVTIIEDTAERYKYQYDTVGNLIEYSANEHAASTLELTEYTYDDQRRIISVRRYNNNGTAVDDYTYTYDSLGRRDSRSDIGKILNLESDSMTVSIAGTDTIWFDSRRRMAASSIVNNVNVSEVIEPTRDYRTYNESAQVTYHRQTYIVDGVVSFIAEYRYDGSGLPQSMRRKNSYQEITDTYSEYKLDTLKNWISRDVERTEAGSDGPSRYIVRRTLKYY